MAASRFNYQCITESGKLKLYASQSLSQIVDEKDDYYDPFVTIIRTDLHSIYDKEYEELEWHD